MDGQKKIDLVSTLKEIKETTDITKIKSSLLDLKNSLLQDDSFSEKYSIDKNYLLSELDQILETRSLERTQYYLKRLIKSLTEVRTGKINDLNLNRWKEYNNIITDSLWIFDKRDSSGAHNAGYWGNFIPQIPNQFLQRYTKKNEWVLDTFLGSGTTLIECNRLGRNGIGIELQKEIAELAKNNLEKESSSASENRFEIITGDSSELDYSSLLEKIGINSVQFVLMHPPYWDIIKFSEKKNDLSNSSSVKDFLERLGKVVDQAFSVLDKQRYLALVIGDKYSNGEWIPLGFYVMQEVLKRKFKLKSTIVKNFDSTKGKMNQKELWRYRALTGGFYIFKHEYIFLFQKK